MPPKRATAKASAAKGKKKVAAASSSAATDAASPPANVSNGQEPAMKKTKTTSGAVAVPASSTAAAAAAAATTTTTTTPTTPRSRAYTTAQKLAITQFVSFTNADKSSAAKVLKQHNWNLQAAVDGFYQGGGSGTSTSSAAIKKELDKLFNSLRDNPKDNPDTVEMEGMMSYLQSINVSIENIGMLLVSQIVQSPTMGEMTREGFVEGWAALKCETLEKQSQHVATTLRGLSSPEALPTFTNVYKHTFIIARPQGQKSVPLDMAVEYWRVLFDPEFSPIKWNTPQNRWLDQWIEFLESNWKKSINKDLWDQTLKFAQATLQDQSLSWWDPENSAWPGVVDEFIEHVKAKRKENGEDGMEVE